MSYRPPRRSTKKSHCSFSKFRSISPEAAADFVVSAIGDSGPEVPLRYCAQCLYGAIHVVYPKDTVDAASEFTREVADDGVAEMKPAVRMQSLQRKHFHAFWTALTRFLTVVRDDKQEIRFLFDFATCKCSVATPPSNPHIAQFHHIAKVIYPQFVKIHGQFVMACIHKMVSTLNDCLAMCNTVKVAQNSQNSRWPTSTKDIIPHGGKITTKAFLRWAHYGEDLAFTAFGVLGHMVKICGSLIIGDITTNPDVGEDFVSTGWRMCRDATDGLCDPDDHSDFPDRLSLAADFRQRATFAAVFLESATTLAPEIFPVLLAGREARMVQLLSLILEVRDAPSVYLDPELDAQFEFFDWTIFSALARQILADHPELQPLIGKLHSDIIVVQWAIEDPLHTVHRVLVAAKSRTRCHAPGCPHSLASTGTEFKRCAACRVAAYCGKACQTRAWKSGPHAHKQICAQVKTLIAKGGGLDDRDAFVENCRKANVSADEALEVAKWEFNPGVPMTASKWNGNDPAANSANPDGASDFDEMFWKLRPNRHPQYAEHWERMCSYWDSDNL